MGNYRDIKAGVGSRKRYADGGRVTKQPKTVINIVVPTSGTPGAPPAPPMGNSPSPAAGPMPPEAAQMALSQMQGKPNAFQDGGTVKTTSGRGKGLKNSQGGAAGGKARLAQSRSAAADKRVGKADGGHVLKAKTRNKLPKSDFGLPGERKYPMPDKSHAANAKARASQMEKAGKLSASAKAKIDAKANRKLEG